VLTENMAANAIANANSDSTPSSLELILLMSDSFPWEMD
jgi:hypothetical protein